MEQPLTAWSWGSGSNGQLGHSDEQDHAVPTRCRMLEALLADGAAAQLVGGGCHSLLLLPRARRLYAWGWGEFSQLSGESTSKSLEPRVVSLPAHEELRDSVRPSAAAAGWDFSAFVDEQGRVFTWGNNAEHQSGHACHVGSVISQPTPLPSLGVRVRALSCGVRHSVAVTEHGTMIGWGECKYGQLTTAATTGGAYSLPVPIELPGVFVTHAACGFRHTLCRSDSGRVFAFGWNRHGQLGCGDTSARTTPTEITIESRAPCSTIGCGWNHSVVLTSTGELFSFGRGNYGQLGLGVAENRSTPTRVPADAFGGAAVDEVLAGSESTLAIVGTRLYAWGWNEHGQLGVGDTLDRLHPTLVALPRGVEAIAHVATGPGQVFALLRLARDPDDDQQQG